MLTIRGGIDRESRTQPISHAHVSIQHRRHAPRPPRRASGRLHGWQRPIGIRAILPRGSIESEKNGKQGRVDMTTRKCHRINVPTPRFLQIAGLFCISEFPSKTPCAADEISLQLISTPTLAQAPGHRTIPSFPCLFTVRETAPLPFGFFERFTRSSKNISQGPGEVCPECVLLVAINDNLPAFVSS